MDLRPADAADLDVVTRLRLAFLADHRGVAPSTFSDRFAVDTRAWVARLHASGRLATWLAEGDGVPVGLASVLLRDAPPQPEDDRVLDGHLLHVWVHPDHRRRGIARALVGACLAAGPDLGVRGFTLHATDAGRPLYEEVGFAPEAAWMARRQPRPS